MSRIVTERISTRSAGRPFASAGASEIFCTTSIPSDTWPKVVYFAVERGLVRHADEELRSRAVRPARHDHGGDRAAGVLSIPDLRLQHAETARPVPVSPSRDPSKADRRPG